MLTAEMTFTIKAGRKNIGKVTRKTSLPDKKMSMKVIPWYVVYLGYRMAQECWTAFEEMENEQWEKEHG